MISGRKIYINKTIIINLLILLLNSGSLFAQTEKNLQRPFIPVLDRELTSSEIFKPNKIYKKPGHYSKQDWANAINSTWGVGLSTTEKLSIFDAATTTLDQEFGAFMNLDINYDSLITRYRSEVANGVSRGRFAAIMNYVSFYLKDTHTMLMDIPVNWGTPLNPGIPLFVIGGFMSNSHFGAALTPLPDSSLLVYKVANNHQLGLEVGDIVLGYDGIPWKILYKELLDAQLPIRTTWIWGSTDESISHQILMSAGMNWHLFDTIDIVKYLSGDTLHLSTVSLSQQTGFIWGNEQLPVPGIEQPDFINEDFVKWGIVEGTDIGYVYIASYDVNPQLAIHDSIYQAVLDFMYNNETSGFIIDYRINYGGSIDNNHRIYKLLFNETVYTIGYDERTDPNNHFGMSPSSWATPYWLRAPGLAGSYYDKPIAILIGPGTVSCGDVESMRMSFHPMVKFFGKPSSGAFTISRYPDLGNPDWFFYLANGTAYIVSNHQYLCHTGVNVDENVWLTQDGVVNGTDDVVEKAINWIDDTNSIRIDNDQIVLNYNLSNNYPNPFNPFTTIEYSIPNYSKVELKIYNALGQEVRTLVNEFQTSGQKSVRWNGTDNVGNEVSSGIYYYGLRTADSNLRKQYKKMILMK